MDAQDLSGFIGPENAAKLGALTNARRIMEAAAQSVARTVRLHFAEIQKDSAHNETAEKFGARRMGVFADAAKSITHSVALDGSEATVTVYDFRVAQRYFGGPLVPHNARFLAIPATAQMYGRSPRTIGGDAFRVIRTLNPEIGKVQWALVNKERMNLLRGKRGKMFEQSGNADAGMVQFWLIAQAVQDGDPTVLPPEGEMIDAAARAVAGYVHSKQF